MTAISDDVVQRLRPFIVGQRPAAAAYYVKGLLRQWLPYLELFTQEQPFPPFELEIQMSSRCNFRCRWCIGAEVQETSQVRSLPDNLHAKAMQRVLTDITNFRENGRGIELVKFSGFIGEPLLPKCKGATKRAMEELVEAGLKVGLFTNGRFMTEDIWPTLTRLLYVNVSLDAGPASFFRLKEAEPGRPFSEQTFRQVLANIAGLSAERKRRSSALNLTVSYVVVPENHHEILETARLVRDAGADAIRFKCDIGGKHRLVVDTIRREAFEQLGQVKRELETPGFRVTVIHEEEDVVRETYRSWNRRDGCYYHALVATLGSDGNLYLCDHNTMPGAASLGNVINEPFEKVWRGRQRASIVREVPHFCRATVCPPFANAANYFLREVRNLAQEHGASVVIEALRQLRAELGP